MKVFEDENSIRKLICHNRLIMLTRSSSTKLLQWLSVPVRRQSASATSVPKYVADPPEQKCFWPQYDASNIFHRDLVPDSLHSPLKHHKDINYYSVNNWSAIAKTHGYNYVDSEIAFMNHHCDRLCVTFSSDYDLCQTTNRDSEASERMLYWPVKILPLEEYSDKIVNHCMEFYENKWSLKKRLQDLSSASHIQFLTGCARFVAPHRYLNKNQQTLFHRSHANFFPFDDVAEVIVNMEDREPWNKLVNNAQIILREKEGRMYNLKDITGFPKECIEMAILAQDMIQDLVDDYDRYSHKDVAEWYRKGWIHYIRGVEASERLNRAIETKDTSKIEEMDFVYNRSGSIGAIAASALSATPFCCSFLHVNDPYIMLLDAGTCIESDGSTFFKEQFESDRKDASDTYKSTNTMDYYRIEKGMDLKQALGQNFWLRNHMIKLLEEEAERVMKYPFADPRHGIRLIRAARQIAVNADYSYFLGNNMPNLRNGWYATTKEKADSIINKALR